jgi:hypothetical protein
MIYELRTYLIPPDRMPDILDRFATVTMRLFAKYHMEVLGFWTTARPEEEYALVYLMRFPDAETQEKAWNTFRADPEWIATRKRTEAGGPIVAQVISKNLIPTSFSPMQ